MVLHSRPNPPMAKNPKNEIIAVAVAEGSITLSTGSDLTIENLPLEHAAGSRQRAGILNTSELEETECSIKVIDDDAKDLDCEILSSRQA
jgi:hypothetical protein